MKFLILILFSAMTDWRKVFFRLILFSPCSLLSITVNNAGVYRARMLTHCIRWS